MESLIRELCSKNINNIEEDIKKYPNIHILIKDYDLEKVLYFFEGVVLIYTHTILKQEKYIFENIECCLTESDESDRELS